MNGYLSRVVFVVVSLLPWSLQAEPLKVVATTGLVGDLVTHIGQDRVEVTALMGTGVDPHLYKATHGDLRRLQQADVIFYNGLHLEGKMQDILEKLARKKPVFAVTSQFPKDAILHFGQATDPHVWFDVRLWQRAGEFVLKTLVELDPRNAVHYQQNAKDYLQQLADLNIWVAEQIQTIPSQQRVLITAHDAFGYFGRAYGMEVRGLQGISTASEFGLHDIKRLKDLIVERHIKAVFVESSVPKKFLQSLVAGVNEAGGHLVIGGELYSDALGLPSTPQATYIGMMQHNVTTIVEALK